MIINSFEEFVQYIESWYPQYVDIIPSVTPTDIIFWFVSYEKAKLMNTTQMTDIIRYGCYRISKIEVYAFIQEMNKQNRETHGDWVQTSFRYFMAQLLSTIER